MSEIKNIILNTSEESLEKILSPFIEEQFPSFVRTDYRKLVLLIKAYYEWMDGVGKPSYVVGNMQTVSDIDSNAQEFYEHFKNTYLVSFPEELATNESGNKPNKTILLKKIRDFYGNKGTESAYRFLFRVLYDSDVEIYYPRKDILKASNGVWIEPKTIKTTSINGSSLFSYIGGEIRQYDGNDLVAQAFIDNIIQYKFYGYDVTEVFLNNIVGDFSPNKTVVYSKTTSTAQETTYSVLGQFFVDVPGTDYRIGDSVIVIDPSGIGYSAKVDQINLAGGIKKLSIVNSGLNYGGDVVVDVFNQNGAKNSRVLALSSAITEYPGYFSGNSGKASANKRIQDSDYYQVYSYVLRAKVSFDTYFETLKQIVHPAGTKMIGSVLVNAALENAISASSQATISQNPILGRYSPYSPRTFNDLRNGYFLPNQVRGATLQVWLSAYNISGPTSNGVTVGVEELLSRNVGWGVRYWNSLHNGITFDVALAAMTGVAPSQEIWLTPKYVPNAVNTHPSVEIRPTAATNPDITVDYGRMRSTGFMSTGATVAALGLTSDRSYFIVFKPRSVGVIGNLGSVDSASQQWLVSDSGGFHGIILGQTGTNDPRLKAVCYNYASSTNRPFVAADIGVTGEWKLLCNTYRKTGTQPGPLSLFLNGVCLGTIAQAHSPSSGIAPAAGVSLGIGCASASITRQFDGEIAEVVLYEGDVGQADRQKIEGYLAHKYGLAYRLPSNHPYKTSPPGASFGDGKWYGTTGDFYPLGYNPYIGSTSAVGSDGTTAPAGSLFINKYSGYTYTVANEWGKTAHNPTGSPLGGITAWRAKLETNPNIGNIPGMVLWLKPENIGVCGSAVSGASVDVWRDASPRGNHALPPTWDRWNGVAHITKVSTTPSYWNLQVYDNTNPITKLSFIPSGLCGGYKNGRLFMIGLSETPTSTPGWTGINYAMYSVGPYGPYTTTEPRRIVIYEKGVNAGILVTAGGDIDAFDNTVFDIEYEEPYVVYRVDGVEQRKVFSGYGKTFYLDSSFHAASGAWGTESGHSITIKEFSYNGNSRVPSFTASSGMQAFSYGGITVDRLRPTISFASAAGATGVCFNGGVLYSPGTVVTVGGEGYTLGGLIGFGNTHGAGVTAARIMTGQFMTLTRPITLTEDADVFVVMRSTNEEWDKGIGFVSSQSDLQTPSNDSVLFHRSYNETDRDPSRVTSEYYKITSGGNVLYPSTTPVGLVGFRPAGNQTDLQQNTISYDPHVSGVCLGVIIGEWSRDENSRITTFLNGDNSKNYSEIINRRICKVNAPSNEGYVIRNGLVTEIDGLTAQNSLAYSASRSNLLTPYLSWKHTQINWLKSGNLVWGGDGAGFAYRDITNNIQDYPLSSANRYRSSSTYELTPGASRNFYLQASAGNWTSSLKSFAWSFTVRIRRADGVPMPASLAVYVYAHGFNSSRTATVIDEGGGWYRVSLTSDGLALPGASTNPNWYTTVTLVGLAGLVQGVKYLVSFPELTTGVVVPHYTYTPLSGLYPESLLPQAWTSTGSFPSGWGINGDIEENRIVYGLDPWGSRSPIWVGENKNGIPEYAYDSAGNTLGYLDGAGDGGFNTPTVAIDPTKTYRFSVWMRAATSSLPSGVSRGSFYYGLYAQNSSGTLVPVSTKDGAFPTGSATNPYFTTSTEYSRIGNGKWTLFVGHVHPTGTATGSNHPNTGRYDLGSGGISASAALTPAMGIDDFIWDSDTTRANLRAYLYYSRHLGETIEFFRPRIEVVDGTEPTIEDLLTDKISEIEGGGSSGTDGVLSGSAVIVPENGGVFSFDNRGVVSTPSNVVLPDSLTWETWVKCDALTNPLNMFLGRHLPYFYCAPQSDLIKFKFGFQNYLLDTNGANVSYAVTSSQVTDTGKWYHLVVTQDYNGINTVNKMFVNGQFRGESTRAGKQRQFSQRISIGDGIHPQLLYNNQMNTQWYPFTGKVSQVRLYSRVLNLDEIEQNFNSLRGRFGV